MTRPPEKSAPRTIPIRNLWYLFLYAWNLARYRERWSADAETAPSLLTLLARVLGDTTHDILRRGLARSYVTTSRPLRGIRGRIDFARSAARLAFPNGRAHCRFDELGVGDLRNGILRATLQRLASDPRVTGGDPRATDALREELAELARRLDGVMPVEPHATLFSRLPVGHGDGLYALAMSVCRLAHRLEMPTEENGNAAAMAVLHDEIVQHQLFERFALNFYRLHLRTEFEAVSETLAWPDEFGSRYAPAMRTDITLRTRRTPARRIVIDTKFSATTLEASPFGEPSFKAQNLYQIYAYLRSQEGRSEAHRNASGILLYPAIGVHLDEDMLIQGHRIRVATVDLAAPWPAIEARMLAIVHDGLPRPAEPSATNSAFRPDSPKS